MQGKNKKEAPISTKKTKNVPTLYNKQNQKWRRMVNLGQNRQHRVAVMMKALVENLEMINSVDVESKTRKQQETARRKEIKYRGDQTQVQQHPQIVVLKAYLLNLVQLQHGVPKQLLPLPR
jgi:hypothetical protein